MKYFFVFDNSSSKYSFDYEEILLVYAVPICAKDSELVKSKS
jgi:hypothetical protein